MNVLHIVNHPSAIESCLEVATDEDAILLIEDGVYLAAFEVSRAVFILADDAHVRGLGDRLPQHAKFVDYDGFVRLAVDHNPIVTWRR